MSRKKRIEAGYRHVESKDGSYSPILPKRTADRLKQYCELMNVNKQNFVEDCVNDRLDELEPEMYRTMSREKLISLLMGRMKRE